MEKLKELLLTLKTPQVCDELAEFFSELARHVRRRSIELRARSHNFNREVEIELVEAIYAYEELLTQRNGRRTRANRTWQMVARYGIIKAAERAVNRPTDALGYRLLVEMGLVDLTFEAVILRYPEAFDANVVELCRRRLAELDHGKHRRSSAIPPSQLN